MDPLKFQLKIMLVNEDLKSFNFFDYFNFFYYNLKDLFLHYNIQKELKVYLL